MFCVFIPILAAESAMSKTSGEEANVRTLSEGRLRLAKRQFEFELEFPEPLGVDTPHPSVVIF
jgi:hypothetical protein